MNIQPADYLVHLSNVLLLVSYSVRDMLAICIAITGTAEVRRRGQRIGALAPGNVIGTALALSGEPSPIEASFSESARYIRWPLEGLRAFVDRRPELRVMLQRFLNRDLATKVEGLVLGPDAKQS